jgi:hypothetical protein
MTSKLDKDIPKIIATLADLLYMQGDKNNSQLLCNSQFEINQTDYDNWNGGTYTYSLHLRIPPQLYAEIGDSLPDVEKHLVERMQLMTRAYPDEYIGSVIITPSFD